jgi:putative flippase GtrA
VTEQPGPHGSKLLVGSDGRYLLVVVGGYCVDLGVAILAVRLGLPLVPAAVLGFICACAATYFAHDRWTFTGTKRLPSRTRVAGFAALAISTIAVRSVLIIAMETVAPGLLWPVAILVIAAGGSLIFNFVISKFVIFS